MALVGNWGGIGNVTEIARIVDSWIDQGKLPPPYVNNYQA